MSSTSNSHDSNDPGRFSPVLLLLFVGSGASAMIYEVSWFHILRLVIGTTAVSLAALLASFMGGMCIGSIAFAKSVSIRHHPLKVYATLEFAIGVMGVLIMFYLPIVGKIYTASASTGPGDVFLRAGVSIVALLPPTILMGATLPAIARWMETSRIGVSRMGFFYGANIAGAVVGTALAGFYLLRVYDIYVATVVAVTINTTVAIVAYGLSHRNAYTPLELREASDTKSASLRWVYLATALSGAAALGAEVVWTRQLSLMFGATVYTFTLILAVYLSGLGIGSAVGSRLAGYVKHPMLLFVACQVLVVAAVPWTTFAIAYVVPMLQPRYETMPEVIDSIVLTNLFDMLRCIIAIVPATLLWGASFPLALAAAGVRGEDSARLVGRIYAANTFGAIVAVIYFSLSAIPHLGTHRTQQLILIIAAMAAAVMFIAHCRAQSKESTKKGPSPTRITLLAAISFVFVALMMQFVIPVPPAVVAYGRLVNLWDRITDVPYLEEGMNSTVVVTDDYEGYRSFHVGGKVVASNMLRDMRFQSMLGNIPALVHPEPKSVLIVGCGAGVTAGTFVLYPSIERIVICELEPLVPDAAAKYFSAENNAVLNDPRTEVIFDDGRHFLATTDETFDIISSDPIHPWVRGAAAIYSQEYFELCKSRLNPGGMVSQWVPLYETSEAAVKSEIKTFVEVFPTATIWNSDVHLKGYDVVMLGQEGPTRIDLLAIRATLQKNPKILESLSASGFPSYRDLLGTYVGQGPDLIPWLQDAQINKDRDLRLQYLAGASFNQQIADQILKNMIQYLRFPEEIFITR